jgi:hypothetical protein
METAQARVIALLEPPLRITPSRMRMDCAPDEHQGRERRLGNRCHIWVR